MNVPCFLRYFFFCPCARCHPGFFWRFPSSWTLRVQLCGAPLPNFCFLEWLFPWATLGSSLSCRSGMRLGQIVKVTSLNKQERTHSRAWIHQRLLTVLGMKEPACEVSASRRGRCGTLILLSVNYARNNNQSTKWEKRVWRKTHLFRAERHKPLKDAHLVACNHLPYPGESQALPGALPGAWSELCILGWDKQSLNNACFSPKTIKEAASPRPAE